MKMLLAKFCVIMGFLSNDWSLANWVDPEEYLRLKAEAEISVRNICPDRSNKCKANQKCVLISRCSSECIGVTQGLLQTDKQFKQHFDDIFCGTCGGKEMICCDSDSVYNEPKCEGVYEDGDDEEYIETATCGKRFSSDSFITGGEDTNPGEWPWMARLIYNQRGTSQRVTLCGGILVSRRHIVTAAHCVETNNKPVSVVLGDSHSTTDYDCLDVKSGAGCKTRGEECFKDEACAPKHMDIRIEDIIIHVKYKYDISVGIPEFDVAVIVLKNPVNFSNFIQPVCLPKTDNPSEGPLTITGWGNTIAGSIIGKTSDILQELHVNEVPFQECKRIWKSKQDIDLIPSHMCANGTREFSGSCKGDSGGPLVREPGFMQVFELAGVVSFGISTCGNGDYPLGFTRIDGEINLWLRKLVGRELPIHPK